MSAQYGENPPNFVPLFDAQAGQIVTPTERRIRFDEHRLAAVGQVVDDARQRRVRILADRNDETAVAHRDETLLRIVADFIAFDKRVQIPLDFGFRRDACAAEFAELRGGGIKHGAVGINASRDVHAELIARIQRSCQFLEIREGETFLFRKEGLQVITNVQYVAYGIQIHAWNDCSVRSDFAQDLRDVVNAERWQGEGRFGHAEKVAVEIAARLDGVELRLRADRLDDVRSKLALGVSRDQRKQFVVFEDFVGMFIHGDVWADNQEYPLKKA